VYTVICSEDIDDDCLSPSDFDKNSHVFSEVPNEGTLDTKL
jgi:hypothetical protein